jgi:hypothetical protein
MPRHAVRCCRVPTEVWTLHSEATSRWDAEHCELWSATPELFFIRAPNGDFRIERSDVELFYEGNGLKAKSSQRRRKS